MCGIVGYIGRGEAAAVLTPALRRLEYRGYDSAGVATVNGHGLEIYKTLGKIAALERLVAAARPSGQMGIAHTRWATHGKPSDANAHPHVDCTGRIAVVHNGIIENYRALRAELTASGHSFRSDTDSEILAHLIEIEMAQGAGLADAVAATAARLRGSYAVACIAEEAPHTIVAMRAGTSPLVVAWSEGEAFLASDTPALVGRCRETIALEDGDLAVLSREALELRRVTGEAVRRAAVPLAADSGAVEKNGYRDFMLKEIAEQPEVIARAWRARLDDGPGTLAEGPIADAELAALSRVVFLACGTSRHAGLIGQYLLERYAGLPAQAAIASECRHHAPVYDEHVLAVPISQSGETADTLAALRQARAAGAGALAICNAPQSSMAREAGRFIDILAGHEIGVAATKSFTAQVVAVSWLALRIAAARGRLTASQVREAIDAFSEAPRHVAALVAQSARIRRIAERFVTQRSCLYLGRGLQYPLALEGALKLKEISYVHAEGCAAGEMKHGPIALIEPGTLVVALAPAGPTLDAMVTSMQEVKARDGAVLALATAGEPAAADLADELIELPAAPDWIGPLLMSVPLQLFAYHLAVLRGCDVDQPRNLAKSVTVE